jgi:hypothetical protein
VFPRALVQTPLLYLYVYLYLCVYVTNKPQLSEYNATFLSNKNIRDAVSNLQRCITDLESLAMKMENKNQHR